MFLNNSMSFVILNIYVLTMINLLLLAAIYYLVLKDIIYKKRYNKAETKIKPFVILYIKDEKNKDKLLQNVKGKFSREVVIDILIEYSRENDVDLSSKFESLGYDELLIKKAKNDLNPSIIKKLAYMRSPKSFQVLKEGIKSKDFDIEYMSFYALSLIKLDDENKKFLIDNILKSNIMRDRIIEIVTNLKLSFDEYVDILEQQDKEIGKVVFLRVLENKEELLKEENSEKILKYLYDEKEVKISAILTMCSSKNIKYVKLIKDIYNSESSWEVKISIAKGLKNFPLRFVQDVLMEMVYDESWWVRFNACETLINMGIQGIDILVELALDRENKNVSDLAYYFLNADKNVYETIKKIEG